MTDKPSVEDRLATLEQELLQLKSQVNGNGSKPNWISNMSGQFKNDAVFDEIASLAKKTRDAEQADYDEAE